MKILKISRNLYYNLPKDDKEYIMMDFYLLTLLNSLYGDQFDVNQNLKVSLQEAEEKLTNYLKDHLLNSVFFAISAEIRHAIYETEEGKLNLMPDFDNKDFFVDYMELYLKKREEYIKNSQDGEGVTNVDRQYNPEKKEYNLSYNSVIYMLSENNLDKYDFVKIAETIFDDFVWEDEFGGESWANICRGWLRLYNAENPNDIIVAIDHVYDLQHNTDTVFNKLKSYYKSGYQWIQKSLDFKANLKNVWKLYEKASPSARSIAAPIIKKVNQYFGESFGEITYEKYSEKLDEKLKKDFDDKKVERFSEVNEIKEHLRQYPDDIARLDNPPIILQEVAVRSNPNSIKHIKNPAPSVQQIAINQNIRLLGELENLDQDVLINTLRKNHRAISYIKNPDENTRKLAITLNAFSLLRIENPTKEEGFLAVSQNPNLISYIENPSEELQKIAVEKDPSRISVLKNPSKKVKEIAIRNDPHSIRFIKNPSENLQKLAVRIDPSSLGIVQLRCASEEVKAIAVKTDPYIILNFYKPSEELQRIAVQKEPNLLNNYKISNKVKMEFDDRKNDRINKIDRLEAEAKNKFSSYFIDNVIFKI